MTQTPVQSEDGATKLVDSKRICKHCAYDLQGTIEHWLSSNSYPNASSQPDSQAPLLHCPECGKQFNPLDPSTTTTAKAMKPVRRFAKTWLPLILLVTTLCVHGILVNWIPVPKALISRQADKQWKLFSWLQTDYGLAVYNRNGVEIRDWIWSDNYVSRAVYDKDNNLLYKVTKDDPDTWSMEISAKQADFQPVLRAFNLTRNGHRFGLAVEQSLTPNKPENTLVTGSNRDVLIALVNHFQLSLATVVRGHSMEDELWYYDEQTESLSLRALKTLPLEHISGWLRTEEGSYWVNDGALQPMQRFGQKLPTPPTSPAPSPPADPNSQPQDPSPDPQAPLPSDP